MRAYFQTPLEAMVQRKQKPASRSLTYNNAVKILHRLKSGDARPLSYSETLGGTDYQVFLLRDCGMDFERGECDWKRWG